MTSPSRQKQTLQLMCLHGASWCEWLLFRKNFSSSRGYQQNLHTTRSRHCLLTSEFHSLSQAYSGSHHLQENLGSLEKKSPESDVAAWILQKEHPDHRGLDWVRPGKELLEILQGREDKDQEGLSLGTLLGF